jgi:predicted thioesterase
MIGATGEKTITVTENVTARAMGSGSLNVFATPAMIALMEAAACAAIEAHLAENQSSVGVEILVRHVAATPLGMQVRARAEVIEVDGRKITFTVQAWDDRELIGEGTHHRVLIDMERFMNRLRENKAR